MNLTGIVESPVKGVNLTTVLTVSTRHMPDYDEDLSECSWGSKSSLGTEFIYAYEEPFDGCPDWLFKICAIARVKYNANWVLLDPAGDVFENDFPVYQ